MYTPHKPISLGLVRRDEEHSKNFGYETVSSRYMNAVCTQHTL